MKKNVALVLERMEPFKAITAEEFEQWKQAAREKVRNQLEEDCDEIHLDLHPLLDRSVERMLERTVKLLPFNEIVKSFSETLLEGFAMTVPVMLANIGKGFFSAEDVEQSFKELGHPLTIKELCQIYVEVTKVYFIDWSDAHCSSLVLKKFTPEFMEKLNVQTFPDDIDQYQNIDVFGDGGGIKIPVPGMSRNQFNGLRQALREMLIGIAEEKDYYENIHTDAGSYIISSCNVDRSGWFGYYPLQGYAHYAQIELTEDNIKANLLALTPGYEELRTKSIVDCQRLEKRPSPRKMAPDSESEDVVELLMCHEE